MAQSSFGFGDVLKWGLVLGGGYLAYSYFIAPSIAAAAAAPVTAPPAPPATAATPPATPPPACPTSSCPPTTDSIAVQKAKVIAAAGTQGALAQTASLWNYWFNQAYALPQSTEWLLGDDGTPMTVDAYLALRHTKGFSGFGGFGAPRGWRRNYLAAGVPMVSTPINYRRLG